MISVQVGTSDTTEVRSRPTLTLIAPFFNEGENVEEFVGETLAVLKSWGRPFELICVDDRSSDDTRERLMGMARAHSDLRIVGLEARCGQSGAIAAGLALSRGSYVAFIDADLQNDPRDLPGMVALLEADPSLGAVVGCRRQRRDSWLRRVSSRIANGVARFICGDNTRDAGCSLKVVRAGLLRNVPQFRGMHRFWAPLIRLAGGRVRQIEVNHRPRVHGVSKYGGGLGRTMVALRDAFGVRWLLSRQLRVSACELERDDA